MNPFSPPSALRLALLAGALWLQGCGSAARKPSASGEAAAPVIQAKPLLFTEPVTVDPDDPAFWIDTADPARSLIIATNKSPAPQGALVVYDIHGKTIQTFDGIDGPNNVDVAYGLTLGDRGVDIAVTTERLQRRLRIFAIASQTRQLRDIGAQGGVAVFSGEAARTGQVEDESPMGISLYTRPRDKAIFALVSRKHGPVSGYLWQYRLVDDGYGRVQGIKVREFGSFSGSKEIEAVAVDNELGYVYYADEDTGIHKWHADPDHPDAARELALFGTSGFQGDREGIAIYKRPDGTGYIVCTDQTPGGSRYYFFAREGTAGNPHDHSRLLGTLEAGVDSTDGIDIASTAFGPQFPHGIMAAMNSGAKNFALFPIEQVLPRR
jgi:3-phytase